MKLTINTTQIQKGDRVVGFQGNVKNVVVSNGFVFVTFTTGRKWNTSNRFDTTVIRN